MPAYPAGRERPEFQAPRRLEDRPSERRETKDFRIEAPAISLPKGGGAIKGIDEQFTVNPSNGTLSLSLPLPTTPARHDMQPALSLNYDSGSGNGIAGVGWTLNVAPIRRRTDRGVPTYTATDELSLVGTDDLVPSASWVNDEWSDDVTTDGPLTIRRFRPRVDNDFARIEQITELLPDAGQAVRTDTWWRVTSASNITTFYGTSEASRIVDPSAGHRVFEWLPSLSVDDQGNCIVYEYVAEDLQGVGGALSEARRQAGDAPFTNRYLKTVRYGNRTPCAPRADEPYRPPLAAGSFLFQLVFDFGEHDAEVPGPMPSGGPAWGVRADPFSTHRSGFEIRTYRLLRRVLMFHQFAELDGGSPTLVRSLDLGYESAADTSLPPVELTQLTSAIQRGYIRRGDGTYSVRSHPPIEFEYEPLGWDTAVHSVDAESRGGLPAGVTGPYRWIDLFSEGIAGVLTEQAGAWMYAANLGDATGTGRLTIGRPRVLASKPSLNGLDGGVLHVDDLGADGRKQVVMSSAELSGYFEVDGESWLPFVPFRDSIRIDLNEAHVRLLDLVGDGAADVLISEEDTFIWHRSNGRRGFEPARRVARSANEDRGPAIVFTDEHQTVFLADMNGDGLTDIVRVRHREIAYWPNCGYGRFGAKVTMDNAPAFDHPDHYDPRFIRLADLSGTGACDVLYLGRDRCTAYLNASGNSWSDPLEIAALPTPAPIDVSFSDILGNGTTAIVWSSPLPAHREAPMRYIDLMGDRKPHVLRSVANNFGKHTHVRYRSSTWFYLRDKHRNRPWVTSLPFPVQCVERVDVNDAISGSRCTTTYSYRHGHYDSTEREFCGFGLVDQIDAEQFEHWALNGQQLADRALHQSPVLTRTWFHTGATAAGTATSDSVRIDRWQAEMERAGFVRPADEPELGGEIVGVAPGLEAGALERDRHAHRRQANRACRGTIVRQEVFALDAPGEGATDDERRLQLTPHQVTASTCRSTLLQPARAGHSAVFTGGAAETVTWHYERRPENPRIEHTLNTAIDLAGRILESATVHYGCSQPDPQLPPTTREAQGRTTVTYIQNERTGDVVTAMSHRLRAVSRVSTYELAGLPRAGALYRIDDFVREGFRVLVDSVEVPAHELDPPQAVGVRRRMLARIEHVFYNADLAAPLPLHQFNARGLPFESYELAFTPALVTGLYAGRVTDVELTAARYVQRDGMWWAPSGRWGYVAEGEDVEDAQLRFFNAIGHVDAFDALTTIGYFADLDLLRDETVDAAGNRMSVEEFDLRTMAPRRLLDANANATEVLLDELGRVKAAAQLGKAGEADSLAGLTAVATPADDALIAELLAATTSVEVAAAARSLLGPASTRFVYDCEAPRTSQDRSPAAAITIKREQYAAVQADSPVQVLFEYSNGGGEIEMAKAQAEPGRALLVTIGPGDAASVSEVDTAALVPPQLRWVGSGRRVVNNKGNIVKEFEPFFSVSHHFESARELVEAGVTRLYSYDALGRIVRVDQPDGTFSRVTFDSWSTAEWDRNDTVLGSVWHRPRANRTIDADLIAAGKDPAREEQAADHSALHAGTPLIRHFDALGRSILDIADNGVDDDNGQPLRLLTAYTLGILGERRSVVDPRGNIAVRYRHDLRGRLVFFSTADGGDRWMFDNVAGDPSRLWDERGRRFEFAYDDPLHRVTAKRVVGGDDPQPMNHVYERIAYGEGQPNDQSQNLRTRIAIHHDTAGRVTNQRFDLQGNVREMTRRFATDYRSVPNWQAADPDARLDAENFVTVQTFDGLNRVQSTTTPDGSTTRQFYNAANLLETVSVSQGAITEDIVRHIDYNARGERQSIEMGNGVVSTYSYDTQTFRLNRLVSARGGTRLQDLAYTFDAVGNLTHQVDACIPTVWFANAMITGVSTYRYDPTYQLIEATGREHAGQTAFGATDNTHDISFSKQYDPLDNLAWRNYTETFRYDPVGNLETWGHAANGNGWTREYDYSANSNRMLSTRVGATTYTYETHAEHGFITRMPHLALMRYGIRDELTATASQVVNGGGTPETTRYVYDHAGVRMRKNTDRAAGAGTEPVRRFERYSFGMAEIEREYAVTGALQRTLSTVHVRDELATMALVESETPAAGATRRLVRYQCPNHLGSTSLETDEQGRVISYEEFHPFGTSAHQGVAKSIVAAAKRYRYTGAERDDETGLQYHGARYYAPWLGRWTAPDQHADRLDGNRYAYVKNNPMINRDRNGHFEEPVHGAATYRLALAAGFTQADAARIAIATAGMDHDPATTPGDDHITRGIQVLLGRTREYHFPTHEEALSRVQGDIRGGVRDLEQFGRHLHGLEDVGFADARGPHTRSDDHRLQSGLAPGAFALWSAGVGLGIAALALSTIGEDWATGLAVGFAVVAVIAALAGLFLLSIVSNSGGLGHPTYETETHLQSNYDNHLADQAFQDPDQNRAELLKIYEVLKQAADAHYGTCRVANDAAARDAIEGVVGAKNEQLINDYLNGLPTDALGNTVQQSYADVVRANSNNPAARVRWRADQIDVSIGLEEHSFTYRRP